MNAFIDVAAVIFETISEGNKKSHCSFLNSGF
jgi:hypothetical protein